MFNVDKLHSEDTCNEQGDTITRYTSNCKEKYNY